MHAEAHADVPLAPDKAWGALADLAALHEWAPDVVESPSDPLGVGAVRRARLDKPAYGKDVLVERVVAVAPGRSFTYDIEGGIGPLASIRTTWSVAPLEGGRGCRVTVASDVVLSGAARFVPFLVQRAWAKQLRDLARAFAAWAPTRF